MVHSIVILFIFFLVSCSKKTPPELQSGQPLKRTALNHLIVVETNFQTGQLESIDLNEGTPHHHSIPIHSDAVVRQVEHYPDRLFVINRLGADNVQLIPSPTLLPGLQYSIGRGSNPQDIAVTEKEVAYVSLMSSSQLLKIHPMTGKELGHIDLTPYADSDGIPEAGKMSFFKDRLYVNLMRLSRTDNLEPTDHSAVAVIDPKTDKVERVHTFHFTNPVTDLKEFEGTLFVGLAGKIGVSAQLDGGIQEIPGPATEGPVLITEGVLGGNIVDFEMISRTRGIAIVSNQSMDRLIAFQGSQRQKILTESKPFSLAGLVFDRSRNLVYLLQRDPPLIRTFEINGLIENRDHRWELSLPPYQALLAK